MDLSSIPVSQEDFDGEKYVQLDDDDTMAVKKDVKTSFSGDKVPVPHTFVGKGVEYAISTKPVEDHIEMQPLGGQIMDSKGFDGTETDDEKYIMLDDITPVQPESAISNRSQEPSSTNSVKIEQQNCEGQNSPQLVRSVTSNTATSGDYNNYDHLLDNISIINISPSRNDCNVPSPDKTAGSFSGKDFFASLNEPIKWQITYSYYQYEKFTIQYLLVPRKNSA